MACSEVDPLPDLLDFGSYSILHLDLLDHNSSFQALVPRVFRMLVPAESLPFILPLPPSLSWSCPCLACLVTIHTQVGTGVGGMGTDPCAPQPFPPDSLWVKSTSLGSLCPECSSLCPSHYLLLLFKASAEMSSPQRGLPGMPLSKRGSPPCYFSQLLLCFYHRNPKCGTIFIHSVCPFSYDLTAMKLEPYLL